MNSESDIPEEIYVARDICNSCGKASAGFLQCETCWGKQIAFITAPKEVLPNTDIDMDFTCLCGKPLGKGRVFCTDCTNKYLKDVYAFNLLGQSHSIVVAYHL